MLNIRFSQVKALFKEDKILDAKKRGTVRALKKAGAFVRSDARRSMKRRKSVSPPGKPPRVLKGQLKRFLFFVVDKDAPENVTIGPVKLNDSGAPRFMEYGGSQVQRRRRRGRTSNVKLDIEPRPFMNPALERQAPGIPDLFKNAFK